MVAGATALVIGEVIDADTLRTGATMACLSFFVIVISYVVAMHEEEI